ncbi:YneF family protein [Paenibacillus thermoaerophilus]|uniref:YneF family protein n=1 Tax=Paenibacillus thermoaerophilus TaxID=1215385 RepID=A0ABW2V2K1_9BACL|nr:YneF family protein [Paenibacillus thermoaerophilus]TMV18314.1 YneF family protein [Paenibacillus thermoaerophilus]
MWTYVLTAVLALIAGLAGGFFIGVFYLRKQLENMQNNPEMMQQLMKDPNKLREMAKKMGYNLNDRQLRQAQQMMSRNQKQQGPRKFK